MSLWKWNDVELEVDMEDIDFLERYETAFNNLDVTEKDLVKTGMGSDIARKYCEMIYRLFDDIFGPSTGKRLLGEKMNIRICEECYTSFIDECQKCVLDADKRRNATMNKFRPNRAQRRASGKK